MVQHQIVKGKKQEETIAFINMKLDRSSKEAQEKGANKEFSKKKRPNANRFIKTLYEQRGINESEHTPKNLPVKKKSSAKKKKRKGTTGKEGNASPAKKRVGRKKNSPAKKNPAKALAKRKRQVAIED